MVPFPHTQGVVRLDTGEAQLGSAGGGEGSPRRRLELRGLVRPHRFWVPGVRVRPQRQVQLPLVLDIFALGKHGRAEVCVLVDHMYQAAVVEEHQVNEDGPSEDHVPRRKRDPESPRRPCQSLTYITSPYQLLNLQVGACLRPRVTSSS